MQYTAMVLPLLGIVVRAGTMDSWTRSQPVRDSTSIFYMAFSQRIWHAPCDRSADVPVHTGSSGD
jgi:hypothetical protein